MQKHNSTNWKATATLLMIVALTLIFTIGATKAPSDIPLRVTIETIGVLASDGFEYRNGENGVKAVFTGDQGRFSFDIGSKRKAHVSDLVAQSGALSQGYYRIYLTTSRDVQDPNVLTNPDPHWHDLHLETLPIGSSTSVGMLFFIRTSSSDSADWSAGFGDYPLATRVTPGGCDNALPAIVTRMDANTWTLIAYPTTEVAGATLMDNGHCLYHGVGNYLGRIEFPFMMTIRRK